MPTQPRRPTLRVAPQQRTRLRGLRLDRQLPDVLVRRLPRSGLEQFRTFACHDRKSHSAALRFPVPSASRRRDRNLRRGRERSRIATTWAITAAITAGEMQHISAGSRGIVHSEENLHDVVEHNYQMWLIPDRRGTEAAYHQLKFDARGAPGPVSTLRLARRRRRQHAHQHRCADLCGPFSRGRLRAALAPRPAGARGSKWCMAISA